MSSIRGFKRYRKYFKNYLKVTLSVVLNRYPINIIFKNGDSFTAKNAGFVHLASTGIKFQYEDMNDILSFNFSGRDMSFHGVFFNNDFADTFGFETYGMISVREKTVVDIGANIGDTAVYFVLKGAKKVVALEPSPSAYRHLTENVQLNDVEKEVVCLNAGVDSSEHTIRIAEDDHDATGIKVIDQCRGATVNITTLESIIYSQNVPKGSVLKIDCEGCEYDSILSSACNTLTRFEEIVMEYHDDPTPLVRKLLQCGYSVKLNGDDVKDSELNKLSRRNRNMIHLC